jgi:hypothetical protein
MRNADRPAGPGKPTKQQRDSATASEELEEMTDEAQGRAGDPERDTTRDPTRSARESRRDAHRKTTSHRDMPGPGRDRSRP